MTGGYQDEKIDDSRYRVEFFGNGHASKERVWNFWIYRCAELTISKGYTYFRVEPLPKSGWLDESAIRPAVFDGIRDGFIKTAGAPVFIYMPGGTITTWSSRGIVTMFSDPVPANVHYALRAQSILDDLDAYVKSDGKEPARPEKEIVARALVPLGVFSFPTIPSAPLKPKSASPTI